MKKRLLSIAIAFCMLLSLLPMQVFAAWDEELGAQIIDLPIIAEGEDTPVPQGLGNSISFFGVIANTKGYSYSYEGQEEIHFAGEARILTTDGSTYLDESTDLAENGVLQMLDEDDKVVAASEAISYYYTEEREVENEDGDTNWEYWYRYVSYADFDSSVYDLSALEAGTYTLQLVADNTVYPCEGAMVVVDSESLLLRYAWANLYIGKSTANVQLGLYGFKTEEELNGLTLNLLDEDGEVVGSTTGNYRNVNVYESYGVPYWNLEAELVLEDDYVLLEDTQYTLQVVYTGDKDLYDGVGYAEREAYTPNIEVTALTVLDPQTGLVELSFESWDSNMVYTVYVSVNGNETVGSYEGTIPDSGTLEMQLGKNGLPVPMTSLDYRLYVDVYEEGSSYSSTSENFENPYYNLNNNNSNSRAWFYPYYVSTKATTLDFTIEGYNYAAYIGTGDVVTVQDRNGNVVATCTGLTEVYEEDENFEAAGTLTFDTVLTKGTYYVYLNGIELDTFYAADTLRMSISAPMRNYDDETFYTNFGIFPVTASGINSSGSGKFVIEEVTFCYDEETGEEYSKWTPVMETETITGKTGEYDNYLYYDYVFKPEDFADLKSDTYYALSFEDGSGNSNGTDLGTYDSVKMKLDLNSDDQYYIEAYNSQFGGTTIPMRLYIGNGSLRNLTEDDLAVVNNLTVCNNDTSTTLTVTGYENNGWDAESGSYYYYYLDLVLSDALTAGYYSIYYGEQMVQSFSIDEPEVEEDPTPYIYNSDYTSSEGYIRGENLPEGNYTAKLYDGYTCLTETAFALTWEEHSTTQQRLYYPASVVADLAAGSYEMRVFLDGVLLDAVTLTVMDTSKPIVTLYDGMYGDGMTRINYSGYYAFEIANAGLYTKLRAAETLEELEQASYDIAGYYAYPLSDRETAGERTVYVQLQTADGTKESDVLTFTFWYMGDEELLDITVHEDLQGIYGGDEISFTVGAENRYASAWMEMVFGDGNTEEIPLRYAGFGLLPEPFPAEEEETIILESAHPYAANSEETWTYTVNGAGSLKVTFSDNTCFYSGDYLYVYAGEVADENYLYSYTGWDLNGETLTIPGDTVTLRLVSGDEPYSDYYGFAVTAIESSDEVIEMENVVLQSGHPYKHEADDTETWTYTVPEAKNIAVSFSVLTEFERGWDYLYIYAGEIAEENLFGKYSGTDLAGVTLTIPGDTVTMYIDSDSSVSYYGFTVTSIVDADAATEAPTPEAPETPAEPEVVLPASDHPFGNGTGYVSEIFTHTVEDANALAVTFSEDTALTDGGKLWIYDDTAVSDEPYKLYDHTNIDQLAGKTIVIPGDSFTILLEAQSTSFYGFDIIAIEATQPLPEEPEDTTGYLHLFTAGPYWVSDYNDNVGYIEDLEVVRFYLTDDNKNVISEVVERELIFGSPDQVILPQFRDSWEDVYTNKDSFTVYGYATPNATVMITDSQYNELGTGTTTINGRFDIELTELPEGGLYFTVSDSSGITASISAYLIVDTTAPVVESVNFTFGESETATLHWVCNDTDIDYFSIYKNDVLVSSRVSSSDRQYTVTARQDDRSHFTVRAYDYAGNVGALTRATADQEAPAAPETLIAKAATTGTITLEWSEGTDNIGILGYVIYVDGKEYVRLESTDLTYTVTGLESGKSYTFAVKSRDKAGNLSDEFSPELETSTVKLTVATNMEATYVVDEYPDMRIPVNYAVTADQEGYTVSVYDAWLEYRIADSDDEWTVQDLAVYSANAYWNIEGSEDDGYLPKGKYEVRVRILNSEDVYVVSDPADVVVLSIDEEAPSDPGTPTASSHTTNSITFTWTASTDNVGVEEYIIYCAGDPIDTVAHVEGTTVYSYTISDLTMGEHKIGVQAVDFRSNKSGLVSDILNTMSLEFDSVVDLESSDYVLEELTDKTISVWAKFKPEEGYTPEISMTMEYKAAAVADSEWISIPLTVSNEDVNYFFGDWDVSGDDQGYLTTGKYYVRFAVTDGNNTAYTTEQSVMLNGETNLPTVTVTYPAAADTVSGKELNVGAHAEDDTAVDKVCFFYKEENTDEYIELGTVESDGSENYVLPWLGAEKLPSGNYTVKAMAYDMRGNMSESIGYFVLDNDAPAVPGDVTATATSRYIHVMWDTGYDAPSDFSIFRVYRSDTVDGEYAAVDGFSSIGYYDDGTTAEAGKTYYYYVTAVDECGNESEPSDVVSATFINDTESPVISDMLPRNNDPLRKEYNLQVIASDNYRLSTAIFYYRAAGDTNWIAIGSDTLDTISDYHVFSLNWKIPASITAKGEYEIRVEVYDSSYTDLASDSGYTPNAPAVMTRTVTIHPYALPVAPEVTVNAGYKKAELSWTYSGNTEVLCQFVVYQTNSNGGSREYVDAVASGKSGSCTVTIPVSGEQYFVVVAQDVYGETADSAVISVESLAKETVPPVAVITPADLVAAKDVPFAFSGVNSTDNDVIVSYAWNFGDGKTGTGEICRHTYTADGTYTVTLTVTDESGNTHSTTAAVTVHDITDAGADHALATITVVNAYEANTPAVAGAEVKITTKDANDNITFQTGAVTAEDGTVTAVVPKGEVIVTVTANGYVATSRTVTVESDETGCFAYTVGMTPMNVSMVDGSLSVTEMTYDEIVKAGIDVTDPDNNHVWKFAAELEFVAAPAFPFDLPSIPLTGYYNSNGVFLGGSGWGWTSLGSWGGGSGGGTGWGMNVGIFPISEHFVLVIYGEAHWLKEMYNVELIVINNSYVDDITNCEATLSLPDGLSLADMVGADQNETIYIGTIPHKVSEEDTANTTKTNWYVRGDKEGEYNLTATVTGNNPEPFVKTFTTDKPVKVYAGTALELTIRAEDIAYSEEEYHVQFELKNVSDKTLYNLSFGITGADQFRVVQIGDTQAQTNLTHEDFGEGMTKKVKELEPGDSIVIDFYTTVWFKSVLELVDMGPFDVGYYLTNVFVTTLEGSSTTIPHKVEIIPSSHGTFFEWLVEEAVDSLEGDIIEILEDKFLGKVPLISYGKKFYEFTHIGEAASRCEITLENGTFTNSNNLLRSRAVVPQGAISVYTDSSDYEISADGTTMIINGDAKIYVEGARAGDAAMTVKTVTILDDGTERENEYVVEYTVDGEAGDAEDLVLQAPAVGVSDGKTAVPLAGETLEITFPYVLMDANGNYQTQAANAQWAVTGDNTDGLSIKNGVLTIESHAKGGEYTVSLTVGEKTATQTITLTRDPSVAKTVEIHRNGALVDSTDLLVFSAGAETKTYTFTAKVIDQYGVEFEHEVEWNTVSNTSGASCANGVITPNSTTVSGSITISAVAANGVTANVDVAVVDGGDLVVEGLGVTATGAAFKVKNESGVSVALYAIAAAYDEDGKMVSLDAVERTLDANSNMDLSLDYTQDKNVTTVQVFVLNTNTYESLMPAWTNP